MVAKEDIRKVKDFAEVVKGITGLVKENYLNGVGVTLSLWEENPKAKEAYVNI